MSMFCCDATSMLCYASAGDPHKLCTFIFGVWSSSFVVLGDFFLVLGLLRFLLKGEESCVF